MAYRSNSVRVRGLADLQRGLRRMGGETGVQMRARLLAIAGRATIEAASLLRSRSKRSTGRMAGTGRPYSRQRGAGIRFTHPGAGVQHWGGTISPRGTPIRIEGKSFATDAVDRRVPETEHELGDMIDDLARGAGGFH